MGVGRKGSGAPGAELKPRSASHPTRASVWLCPNSRSAESRGSDPPGSSRCSRGGGDGRAWVGDTGSGAGRGAAAKNFPEEVSARRSGAAPTPIDSRAPQRARAALRTLLPPPGVQKVPRVVGLRVGFPFFLPLFLPLVSFFFFFLFSLLIFFFFVNSF